MSTRADKTTQAVYEFTFEDVQTSVELSKADLTDGKELPGASLQVLDSRWNCSGRMDFHR